MHCGLHSLMLRAYLHDFYGTTQYWEGGRLRGAVQSKKAKKIIRKPTKLQIEPELAERR